MQYISLKVKILGEEDILCNIYAPNKDDPLFLNSLFEQLENFADSRLIIGGDFNLVQDINLDKMGIEKNTDIKAQNVVQQKMSALDLIDVWRVMNAHKKQFTRSRRHPDIKCRLDYFLISSCIMNKTKHVKITPGFRTDHSLVMPLSHDRIFVSVRRRMGTRRISKAHVLFKLRTRPERSS